MHQPILLEPLHQPVQRQLQDQPRVIALALVKNEGDIVSYWLSHVCELFDLVYIVDHQSTDGTREFLLEIAKAESKIHLFSFEHPGYFQSEIINQLAQEILQKYPNVWLFPLDADEFINVTSRDEFLSLLDSQDREQILLLNWRNCLPMYMNDVQMLQPGFPCLFPPHRGIYNKVAVNGKTLMAMNFRFIQGNHGLEDETGNLVRKKVSPFLNLNHLPIRSIEHFALKCIQGYLAKVSLPPERDSSGQLVHWKDMMDRVITSGDFDVNMLRKFVCSYGQPNELVITSIYNLIDQGWIVDAFSVPANLGIYRHFMNRKLSFMDLAQQLLRSHPHHTDLQSFLRIVDGSQKRLIDVQSWQRETNNTLIFKKFPESQDVRVEKNSCLVYKDIEILNTFIAMANTRHENPVPSTWEGHIPFLYCLLDFARPRRFVELGSHYGNCFFAACQMSKLLSNAIECVAIDTWLGDEHAGKYQEDVFRRFSYILHRDYPNGRFIRKLFSDAATQFEDNSIDLLHIDGLHTYEAVAEDYQTWLPKISDRGIIMFHDTQVRERDFGVWRLWAEVSKKYPSFEFEHGHGLGVLLVGEKAELPIQKLFELFAMPEYLQFVRFFFSNAVTPLK